MLLGEDGGWAHCRVCCCRVRLSARRPVVDEATPGRSLPGAAACAAAAVGVTSGAPCEPQRSSRVPRSRPMARPMARSSGCLPAVDALQHARVVVAHHLRDDVERDAVLDHPARERAPEVVRAARRDHRAPTCVDEVAARVAPRSEQPVTLSCGVLERVREVSLLDRHGVVTPRPRFSYRLQLVAHGDSPVKLEAGWFKMRRAEAARGRAAMVRWYTEHARAWLTPRAAPLASRVRVVPSDITVQDLGFRWSSCGKGCRLYFHWQSILFPPRIVEYVLILELVHLRVSYHTRAFWRGVERVMPDWGQRRRWLAEHGGEFVL
jgi:hypothetical protein